MMTADNYTVKDCNLRNLLAMFTTCLDAIDLCLDDGNIMGAKHRIEETEKSIWKLQEANHSRPKEDR